MKGKSATIVISAMIGLLLIPVSISLVLNFFQKLNSFHEFNLKEERLNIEDLIAQKHQVKMDLTKLKDDLAAEIGKNEKAKITLTQVESKLYQKEEMIAILSKEFSSLKEGMNLLAQIQECTGSGDPDRKFIVCFR
jgi:regulator of replication initiation timing